MKIGDYVKHKQFPAITAIVSDIHGNTATVVTAYGRTAWKISEFEKA